MKALVEFVRMLPTMHKKEMTLYEEYVSEDFESDLLVFNEHTRKKILNKLRKEKNKMNFLSHITEVKFGLFYAQNGAMTEYEKKYKIGDSIQEPDWTITLGDQTFISEVLRLNPTQKDQNRNDFDKQLINKIEQIEGNYFLQVDFENEYFQIVDYDLNSIIEELKSWFSEKRNLLDQITLFNNFTFTIIKEHTSHNYILASGNVNLIEIDKRRLESSNSEFYKKIDKYTKLIEVKVCPFIISIDIDFVNGLDEEDVSSFLYGRGIDDRVINSVYTDLSTGLFYNNTNAQKYLSGVMVRRHKTHTYFHNYSIENKLNSANRDFLISLTNKQCW